MRRQFILLIGMIAILTMCNNWGWENIESDQEAQLNIFGLVSLDTSIISFVQVRQTLNLGEDEDVLIATDTVWYGDSPYDFVFEETYRSKFMIDSAVVTISDGTQTVRFFPVYTEDDYSGYYKNEYLFIKKVNVVYLDTLHRFIPQPQTNYYLEVTVPDGREVTGILITPAQPSLEKQSIPDTLHLLKSFTIPFAVLDDDHQILRTITEEEVGENEAIIEPGKASWSSLPESFSDTDDEEFRCTMEIRLTAMDANYYRYFVQKPLDDEFVSFVLGEANSGLSCGIEGGFGLFGAIAVDRIYRIAVR